MNSSRTESAATRELLSILEVPLRRPFHVIVPFVLVTLVALVAAYLMPRQYRTSTLILVEAQKVPASVVRTADESTKPRLQTIRQEILSRTRLERIIQELRPYPTSGPAATMTDLVETMRNAVTINVKGEDAFTLEFTHRDPKTAQAVANRLAGLFIEEAGRSREEQVSGALAFIESQLEDARKQLEQKDQDLRRYKEAHMGRLPEQLGANLATLQRLQLEQQSLASSLQSARQRLMVVERGSPDPGSIDARSGSRPSAADDLASLRSQLAQLLERYTDEHPDVQALRSRIARLEAGALDVDSPSGREGSASPGLARAQEARLEVRTLEENLADVAKRIQTFQQRVEEVPRAEQELATLTRDYQKLSENYSVLLNKKLEAQMAERLEKKWKGERFSVLDPAFLPEQPYWPNRPLVVGIGMLLGLLLGVAAAYITEFLDSSVKSAADLEVLSPLPLLGFIPAVETQGRQPTSPGLLSGLRHVLQRRRQRLEPGFKAAATSPAEVVAPGAAPPSGSPPAFEETAPVAVEPKRGVAAASMRPGATAEEFRSFAARVRYLSAEKPMRCFGVVSAVPGEGKSTVSAGLALALAKTGSRVLLLEADLRCPSLCDHLGLERAVGVTDWLRTGAEPVRVQPVRPGGFLFLSGGRSLRQPEDDPFGEPAEVDRMRTLIEASRRQFDFVVVDCPPLLPVADAVVLQELLDGFIVVVRERYAPMEKILQALDRLDPEKLRGVVLNDHLEVLPRYKEYQGSYYVRRA